MLTRLTSLTSFAHLPNLEYLDISQNRIETLTGSDDMFYK